MITVKELQLKQSFRVIAANPNQNLLSLQTIR